MQDEPGTGFGLMGVAPEAELGMYRIFGCTGGSSDELIMDAMMRAAEDGALFEIFANGEPAGVVSAPRDDDHGLTGHLVQEICLDE